MIRIRKERVSQGVSQTELAFLAGTVAPTVSAIENRRLVPYAPLQQRLADVLGVPVDQLLDEVDEDART